MTELQIKDYLQKYNLTSEELLAEHIEQLKRNTVVNNELIFPLVEMMLNNKSVLLSFFREIKKEKDGHKSAPFFLDEMVTGYTSTRHKSRNGETHPQKTVRVTFFNKDYSATVDIQEDKIETFARVNGFSSYEMNFDVASDTTNEPVNDAIKQYPLTPDECFKAGVKETEGKLNYELDWDFIQQMAEKMQTNKSKYKPYNWKQPIDIESLKQAMFRHVIEIMKGNYSDDGREFGHLESVADNAMMLNFQLKNNG